MSFRLYLKRTLKFILHGTPVVTVKANIAQLSSNTLLKNKCALITGGTSGIGLSIAKAFISAGAAVVITGRDQVKIDVAVRELKEMTKGNNNVWGIALDNTMPELFADRWDTILKLTEGKKIDILVNNAGVLGGHISSSSIDEYDKVMNTNLRGVFFLSQLVGHYMKENGIQGNILNVASSSSLRPAASAYTISKWGIRGLTLGLARVLSPYGITVNGLAPGPTATPMLMKKTTDNLAFERNPLGRYALPEEIANMAVILVSDMSKTIVGDIVYMTGGAGNIYNEDMDWNF